MKKIELEQGTPEWLALRKKHIGSSDAPVVMDVSPYKTQYRLWEEKLSLTKDQDANFAMRRGTDMEAQARERFMDMSGLFVVPQTLLHPNISYMMASLDGIDIEGKNMVEIKCPGQADHAQALAGQVPSKYYPQLQHQLEVCKIDFAYYFSFDGKEGVMLKVGRDEKYIADLLEKERIFWEKVEGFIAPELTQRDLVLKTDKRWKEALDKYQIAKTFLGVYEDDLENARQELIELANGQSSEGYGARLIQVVSKGSVDYKKIPELEGVDLDKYRKAPNKSWRLTLQKEGSNERG